MVDSVYLEEFSPSLFPYAGGIARPGVAARESHRTPDDLVAAYRYLCGRGARKFWRCGLERSDLEQVAAIGLIKASRRYDASVRTPFEPYAWMMIVGELMHYVRDYECIVRIPRRLSALQPNFRRAFDSLVARMGREPSDDDLAAEIGVPAATVAELRRARESAIPLSLDDAECCARSADGTLSCEDRVLFGQAFAGLEPVERRIIVGIYVLGLKQLEVAHRLGLSAKRVSRLHHAALARMQRTWMPL